MNINENEIKKYWIQGVGSDCYPWELVKKVSDITLEIRKMDSKEITPAHTSYGAQKWKITSNKENEIIRIRKNKNGVFKAYKCGFYPSDKPCRHHDYSF